MVCPELTKNVCTQEPSSHFCARVQGRDLVLGHRHCAQILACSGGSMQGRGPAPTYFWTKMRPEGQKKGSGLQPLPPSPLSQNLYPALCHGYLKKGCVHISTQRVLYLGTVPRHQA